MFAVTSSWAVRASSEAQQKPRGFSISSAGGTRASVPAGAAIGATGAELSSCGDAGGGDSTGSEGASAPRCSLWSGPGARTWLGRGSTARSGEAGVNAELSALEAGTAAASLDAEDGCNGAGSVEGNGGCATASFGGAAGFDRSSTALTSRGDVAGGSDGCATTAFCVGATAGGGSVVLVTGRGSGAAATLSRGAATAGSSKGCATIGFSAGRGDGSAISVFAAS